jgi:tetratricopeptide (TPR) repeat protein
VEIQERLVAEFPGVPRYRQNLAMSYGELGILLTELGQRSEAEQAYRRELQIEEQLVAEAPTDPDCPYDLANGYNNLGTLLRDSGQNSTAEQAYRRAIEIKEKLATDYPTVSKYRHDLSMSHYNLGNVLRDQQQWAEAEAAYTRGLRLREKLAADFPSVPKYRRDLAGSHDALGSLFRYQKQWPGAQQAFRWAMEAREKLAADFPAVPDYRLDLAGSYVNFGQLLADQGEAEASLPWFVKAITLLDRLLVTEPRQATACLYLRNAHWSRANSLHMLGRYAEAVSDWTRALELNADSKTEFVLRRCRTNSLLGQGDLAGAETECRVMVRLQPDRAEHQQALGDLCARSGHWDQALEAIGKAVELDGGNDWYWSQVAVLQIRTGAVAAYHRTSWEVVQRFKDANQPAIAARTAMACLLLPKSEADLEPFSKLTRTDLSAYYNSVLALVDRARIGTETDRRYRYVMLVKALAEHRAGRNAEAVTWIEQIAPNPSGGVIDATAFAVLAMAKHRLGHHDDVRAALAKAQGIVASKRPDPAHGRPFANDWDDWLRCEILLLETETTQQGKHP